MENQPKREDTVTNPKYNAAINPSHCPSTYLLSSSTTADFCPDIYIHSPVINNGYSNIGNVNSKNCANTNTIVASADVENGGFKSLVDKEEAFLDSLPAGYRFRPYDTELVGCYLKGKINNERLPPNRIREVELYKHNPDYLAANYKSDGENEWYFFTPRDRKYPNGDRPSRAAGDGYWKATGADKPVKIGGVTVGFRRALVFYRGKPAKGDKTNWIMHEYRVNEPHKKKGRGENNMKLDDWVLCRIYKKFDRAFKAPTRARGLPLSNDDAHEQETISMPVVGSYEQEIYPYLSTNLVTSHHFNELAESFDEHFHYGNPSLGPVLGPNLPFQGYPKPSNEYFSVPPLQNMDTLGDFYKFDQSYDDHTFSNIALYPPKNGSDCD